MAQQEKSGLNEATEISAHAAGAVRGAIKTGKAVSGAAKGTAAAGPYGAAAAALWTHRKAVVAIIAGLLAIPVLFIMLLPSLIFGGLTQAGSEGNPDSSILNDNAAIVENINQISQAISDLLEEGQEDVRARIDADFAASGADQKEIINPYESSPAYNANRFIAMYCAAKDQDYASISLKDMEALIRKAKDALYTFTSTEEPRTTTVTDTTIDQNTGNVTVTETEVTEIWKIYIAVCGTGGAGSTAQGIAVGAAGAPLNVQHIHAAAGQQGAAAGCVGIGRQGQLTALGPGADRDDKRLIGKAAHQRQRGGMVGGGQRVKAQLHQLGGGVGLRGGGQRTQGIKAAGEQRHDDARRSGGEGKTAKGQHKDHPLGAFSPF